MRGDYLHRMTGRADPHPVRHELRGAHGRSHRRTAITGNRVSKAFPYSQGPRDRTGPGIATMHVRAASQGKQLEITGLGRSISCNATMSAFISHNARRIRPGSYLHRSRSPDGCYRTPLAAASLDGSPHLMKQGSSPSVPAGAIGRRTGTWRSTDRITIHVNPTNSPRPTKENRVGPRSVSSKPFQNGRQEECPESFLTRCPTKLAERDLRRSCNQVHDREWSDRNHPHQEHRPGPRCANRRLRYATRRPANR